VPQHLADQVRVGTMVRVVLHGRRVGGWVVAGDVAPGPGITLRPLASVRGWGPSSELIELAGWAAHRWAGRRASLLRTASPERAVRQLPSAVLTPRRPALAPDDAGAALVDEVLSRGDARAVVRLPPAAAWLGPALAVVRRGPALVITASIAAGQDLAAGLRQEGLSVAVLPEQWAQAAAGVDVIIGARAAAWGPAPQLGAVLVLDGHDEALQQEQAPTWNAWQVAVERARRRGVPAIVVSPCPTLELLAWGPLATLPRTSERRGWAALEVADRRQDDPRTGLYSPRLVRLVAETGRVVCVLNRKGRARLLACAACGELARCERCGAAVVSMNPDELVCRRCGLARPMVCLACGSTVLKLLRIGVARAREELEALTGKAVGEVTADTGSLPSAPVLVGTEAVLHRVSRADAVAFLEFDQELLAPRYRAAEEALALLARASRVVGGRRGRVLVQTRLPHHEVIQAALLADPGRLSASEAGMRAALGLPPERALALISGEAAAQFVRQLRGVEVNGPDAGRWLVRAAGHEELAAALAATPRPAGRLRVEVDPARA
jgi:primosomal protein N' (replication factor Y) (superfamily II helicase)